MARKQTTQQPPTDPELLLTREEAALKIRERVTIGSELLSRQINNISQFEESKKDYQQWDSYNKELLTRLFTTHKYKEEYARWTTVALTYRDYQSEGEELRDHKQIIKEKNERLRSISERLELIPLAAAVSITISASNPRERTNKVFVVHGHEEGPRESVARFLERLGLEAVILHEQATGGRTIIEKLEHYSDADFAIVLLTPDDIGGVKTSTQDKLQARARQNVILELGYFVGKLGRKHVCALHKGPLELPSDYLGVVYVSLDDNGGWRLQLAKELRGAGFTVDMNLVI